MYWVRVKVKGLSASLAALFLSTLVSLSHSRLPSNQTQKASKIKALNTQTDVLYITALQTIQKYSYTPKRDQKTWFLLLLCNSTKGKYSQTEQNILLYYYNSLFFTIKLVRSPFTKEKISSNSKPTVFLNRSNLFIMRIQKNSLTKKLAKPDFSEWAQKCKITVLVQ